MGIVIKCLAASFLLLSFHAVAGPQLYVFDCGTARLENLDMFNIKPEESDVRELFIPCYLIRHDNGILLWDGGLPKEVVGTKPDENAPGPTMRYDRWIIDQLADMDLAPADITYAAYSHLHFDHAGAANDLVANTVLMQQAEWDKAFDEGHEFVDPRLFAGLKTAKLQLIEGDFDVFGDGSVRLIYTPGHTPGHQSLLVMLENTGPVVLSGDLYHTRANRTLRRVPTFNYNAEQTLASMDKIDKLLADTGATLWIGHDKELADTLKKAPAYYD
ncbi:MAG: N-acyl homoserine lactonase family protein [Haliea sp.]|jgi:N-acyl homoserine lactone hydrolase|nr:N-acyl homoserine lactonase family protein [Haliea sp.]